MYNNSIAKPWLKRQEPFGLPIWSILLTELPTICLKDVCIQADIGIHSTGSYNQAIHLRHIKVNNTIVTDIGKIFSLHDLTQIDPQLSPTCLGINISISLPQQNPNNLLLKLVRIRDLYPHLNTILT